MLNEAKVKSALTELRNKINLVENPALKSELNHALLTLIVEVMPADHLLHGS